MWKYASCRLVEYPLQVWFIGPTTFGEPLLFFLRAADVHADPTLHTLAPYDTVDGHPRRRQVETGGRDAHPLSYVCATGAPTVGYPVLSAEDVMHGDLHVGE